MPVAALHAPSGLCPTDNWPIGDETPVIRTKIGRHTPRCRTEAGYVIRYH